MQPTTLTQGQSYMGGTVQYDTATGKPLAKGATTMSSVVGTPDKPIATNQYSEAIGPKPVPFLSSESGGSAIQKAIAKLDTITAPKPVSTVVKTQQQLDAESGKHNQFGYDASGKALANPNAGDNSFTADQLTQAGIVDPIAEGLKYNASTGTYYVDNNAPASAQIFLESTRGNQQANTSLQTDSDWALNEMKKGISGVDAVLADTLANIASDYQNRKAQLEQANNANLSQIQTQGYRYGTARYSSSLNTQLISTEERAGMQKLSELATQTQSLVVQAKQAAASQKFDMLSKYMDEIDKKRKEQTDAAAKLAEEKAKQDKIIADRLRQSTIDTNVSSLLAKGVTDPKDILGALNYDSKGNLVGDVSSKDIADAIKNLTRDDPNAKNIYDVQKTAGEAGATPQQLAEIAKSKNANEAMQVASKYGLLTKATGWMAEYKSYERDAISRGLTPMTPVEFKNWDDNNKAKAAAAANAAGSGLNSKQVTVFNGIVDKYTKSPLVAANDRATVLRTVSEKLKANPTDASLQLSFIYSMVQALDTYQSAVREGEIGMLQSTQGLADKLANIPNQIESGSLLSTDVINKYINTAQILTDSIKSASDSKLKQYGAQAKIAGVGDAFNEYAKAVESIPNTIDSALKVTEDTQSKLKQLASDPAKAQQIQTLGKTVNPETGEVLTLEEIYQVMTQ